MIIYTHEYEDEPICPYCGHVERDAWEISFQTDDCITHACNSCGEDYTLTRHVSVSYSSGKKAQA